MHRTDAAFATATNQFTDGDQATGTQATVVDAPWLNDVQENLCGVIEGAGIALAKGDYTQLFTAIQNLITAGIDAANLPPVVQKTVDPSAADDVNAGYTVGESWINTTTNEVFRCLHNTAAAAVWAKTTLTVDELGALATLSVAGIAQGGTGATDAATARTNLGLGALATVAVAALAQGGTGATTAAGARANLGLSLPLAVGSGGTGADTANAARTNIGIGKVADTSYGALTTGEHRATSFQINSARRFKERIRSYVCSAADLDRLRLVKWRWRDIDAVPEHLRGTEDSGVIADDVAEVFPGCVHFDAQGRPESVDYGKLAVHLVLADRATRPACRPGILRRAWRRIRRALA